MIQNIIWDFDGTLFDTYSAINRAFKQALVDFGIDIPEAQIRLQAHKSLTLFAEELAKKYDLNVEAFGSNYYNHYKRFPVQRQPPFPGVRQVCSYICARDGVNLIVTHRDVPSANILLKTFDMETYFSGILSAGDDYPFKPDPAMVEEVIRRFSLNKEQTLAVGDREIDIQAGQAASVRTCLFVEECAQSQADLCINNYQHLMEYLLRENGGA